MYHILHILSNDILQTAVISWFAAQLLKIFITLIVDKKLDLSRITGSGGMPSSHSSFTAALAVAVGFIEGFDSVMFALAAAFSIVVMYDAANVRRRVGEQAAVLNKLLDKESDDKLTELVGHKPAEVLVGAVLGVLIATLRYI